MTDLDKLIEGVEAGAFDTSPLEFTNAFKAALGARPSYVDGWCAYGWGAYLGSLDAAEGLHDALLPEWEWEIRKKGDAFVADYDIEYGETTLSTWGSGHLKDPARAWLLAQLRAVKAKEDTP